MLKLVFTLLIIWKTIQSGLVRTILPTKKYRINRKK